MSDVPNINDMLKLYTKKELWERIQHHIKKIDNLQHQLNHQKAMWNELKEWIKKTSEEKCKDCFYFQQYFRFDEILEKMQELENGEKDVKD